MKVKDWFNKNKDVFIYRDLNFLANNFFNQDLTNLFLTNNDFIDAKKLLSLEKIKEAYKTFMPLPYLLGQEEFYGRRFRVDKNVLIPRKETELLVEAAIEIINKNNFKKVLDLACGSGVIAITIKLEILTRLEVSALDLSLKALSLAKLNAKNLKAKVNFVHSDLFNQLNDKKFDIIISNPPYVSLDAIKGSLIYEPRMALDGGVEGFFYIDKIIDNAFGYLSHGGYLLIEIGYNQKKQVERKLKNNFNYELINWIKDYDNHWRGVILKKKEGA